MKNSLNVATSNGKSAYFKVRYKKKSVDSYTVAKKKVFSTKIKYVLTKLIARSFATLGINKKKTKTK